MFMYNQKEYQKKYHTQWYKEHKKSHGEIVRERIKRHRQWFNEYKSTLKCEMCPESHVATLDFHHIDPSQKEAQMSRAIANGWSKKKILEEVEKCKVLCANCHRKLHWENDLRDV